MVISDRVLSSGSIGESIRKMNSQISFSLSASLIASLHLFSSSRPRNAIDDDSVSINQPGKLSLFQQSDSDHIFATPCVSEILPVFPFRRIPSNAFEIQFPKHFRLVTALTKMNTILLVARLFKWILFSTIGSTNISPLFHHLLILLAFMVNMLGWLIILPSLSRKISSSRKPKNLRESFERDWKYSISDRQRKFRLQL